MSHFWLTPIIYNSNRQRWQDPLNMTQTWKVLFRHYFRLSTIMQCTSIASPCPSASFIPWSVILWCSPQHKYQALGIRELVHHFPSLLQVDSTVQSFVRGSTSGLSSSQTSSRSPDSNSLIPLSRLSTSSYNKEPLLLITQLSSIISFLFLTTASVRTWMGQCRLFDTAITYYFSVIFWVRSTFSTLLK